jgi:Sugar-transfer associated ATP-grasp
MGTILKATPQRINRFLSAVLGVRITRAQNPSSIVGSDEWHNKAAFCVVSTIEKFNGQKLSPKLRQTADEYSIEVLGKIDYAPWLYVYSLVSGTFKEGWIPDNYFGNVIAPRVNKGLGGATEFKSFTNAVLKTDYLPDIGYHIDGVLYDRTFNIIGIDWLKRRACELHPEVFLKRDGTRRGEGIVKAAAGDLTFGMLREFGNCVIQRPVMQHQFFENIIPGSVATVRITTVKESNGSISTRAAYLRLGRNDTAWVQADNSVKVAIVDRNGELDKFAYTHGFRRWTSHPDTNFSFQGHRVPEFRNAVNVCEQLHCMAPHFTIIGWDIAINAHDKVELLEWNGSHCGISFSEATTGPCFLGLNWEKMNM